MTQAKCQVKRVAKCLMVGALFLSLAVNAQALENGDVESLVQDFYSDPKGFMLRSPSGGASLNDHDGPLVSEEVLAAKNFTRERVMRAAGVDPFAATPFSGMKENIEQIVDPDELKQTNGKVLRDPTEMDSRGFQTKRLKHDAWSDSYWPTFRGGTAQRYALRTARNASSWVSAWSFVQGAGRTFWDVVTGNSSISRDDLAPAEKYDLLISSARDYSKGILSRSEWRTGQAIQEEDGEVPGWYGHCDGWAAASFMLKRPTAAVNVPSGDGSQMIRFYPSDIKALATVLWANATPETRFIGSRCNETNPRRDANGRIISERCFDTNPGTFHMAMVNQLASANRHMIIDATYDAEVWNQPVHSYSIRYFNPQTGRASESSADVVIPMSAFTRDRFKSYRSSRAVRIVGVVIELEYLIETSPAQRGSDGPQYDATKKVRYMYDLELDASGLVQGGEWYQTRHPDFLWVPRANGRAVAENESELTGSWDPTRPLPSSWQQAARKSANRGVPLGAVVEALISQSRRLSGEPETEEPESVPE